MKKEPALTTGISAPETVDNFMKDLKHPMTDVISEIRRSIMATDKNIGEGISWNAPVFFYSGKLPPFNPKEYKRYIVGFNLFKQDALRLIFLQGAALSDPNNLLEGDYKDGRRIITITGITDFKNKEKELKKFISELIKIIAHN
ncbi:DUF1801 domain-containing protein [Chitinophaga silvatica]|uniref:DUF1801 domain-containing protein n=1 Tax=Chitinophaga silvatica TaxID=2282649 RepID=A0A3E1Y5I7_9BACT|nr:DUF1801 domain-containing protein [Chitinophaga silvatica]RFS19991.1 DUF1801 domain-containing protein [Chitinophaga silvatica]